jgi:polysaccharide export outer membrane protein
MLPVLTLMAACGQTLPPISVAEVQAGEADYALGAGDRIRVTVFNEPTLTGEYGITTAGDLAFPLIGTVPAAGRTIEQLQATLTQRLGAGYVNDPRVSIEVIGYRPYFILGEVAKPGQYPYAAGLTLEQAVAAAGGYTYRANTKSLFLRRSQATSEKSVELNGPAVKVLPGDTIRVGERYF